MWNEFWKNVVVDCCHMTPSRTWRTATKSVFSVLNLDWLILSTHGEWEQLGAWQMRCPIPWNKKERFPSATLILPQENKNKSRRRRRSHNIRINQTSDHSRFNIVHHTRNWTIFLLGFMLYVCSNHRDCVTLPHSEMNSSVEWTEGQTLSNLKPKPDPRADVEVFLLWYDLSDSLPVRLIQSCGSSGVFF